MSKIIIIIVVIILMFIYFWERERERVWVGKGQTEKETLNPKQASGSEPSTQSPTWGLIHEPQDHDLTKVQHSTDWATQAP